jgi:hypothetical protein
MRTRQLSAALALTGLALFARTSAAQAQTTVTLFSATGTLSAPLAQNPRNGYWGAGTQPFAAVHTVSLTAGNSYTIRVLPTAGGQTTDSYVYLLDPSGAIAGQDDDSGYDMASLSSKLVFNATATGTYTVVVTTYYYNYSMNYGLTVDGPPGAGGAPNGIPNVRLLPNPTSHILGAPTVLTESQARRTWWVATVSAARRVG